MKTPEVILDGTCRAAAAAGAAMKTLEYILDGASGSEADMKTPEVILDGPCS